MKRIALRTNSSFPMHFQRIGSDLRSGYFSVTALQFAYILLLLILPVVAMATHIVGGQLEMTMVGNQAGHFEIKMTYYYNEAQTANLPQPSSNVVIFRKSDGKKMAEFTLPNLTLSNRPPVVFANPTCALSTNLRISRVEYKADIQLDINEYSDPQGYYLIQQNCCRNAAIANLTTPQSTPFLFYLEFPALLQAGQVFLNSSPVFTPLTGEYICVGSPFTFSTIAIDPDGDELRYSLVSPLAGTFLVNANMAVIKPAPYPEVSWKAGFGPQQAIPGNPSLAIDQRSGILSVKATQPGLFVFSVRVEEYRQGVKIGEVRRDLQLLVLDCPTANLPTPAIRIQNQPITSTVANLCKGRTILLQTTNNADWNYQWSKNSIPVIGETRAALTVVEPGDYTVMISLASGCSQWVSSEKVHIIDASSTTKLVSKGRTSVCKSGGTVELSAPAESRYTYRWFRDGIEVGNQTGATLTADQPGQYSAIVYDIAQACPLRTDTIRVTQRPDPIVRITPASATTAICSGDSLLLTASGASSYRWSLDGVLIPAASQPAFYAKTPGTISVTGKDTAGCEASSAAFMLAALTKVRVTFDSLPAFCGTDAPPVRLTGSPAGGVFSGKGVVGDQFNPGQAGIGNHELTYTIQHPANECYRGTARRQADVSLPPTVDLPAEVTIYKGGSIDLQPVLTGQPVQFAWTPATFLTASGQPSVRAVDVEADIQYTLTVTGSTGCQGFGSIQVRVYQRVWVPDAFTPNGDGVNDTWRLPGIDAYPQAQLTIYNRWGEIVYQTTEGYTHPFDGTYRGERLPTGTYTYMLHPAYNRPVISGSVLLIR